MKIQVVSTSLTDVSTDALVVLHEEAGLLGTSDNPTLAGHFKAFVKAVKDRSSKREWFCSLDKSAGVKASYLLLDSVTFTGTAPHDEPLKTTAARAVNLCRDHSIKKITFAVHHKIAAKKAAAIIEGAILGDFYDARFKGTAAKANKRPELTVIIAVPQEALKETKAIAKDTLSVAESVNSARELLNSPHHVLTPKAMASYAQKLSKKYGMKCTVLDEKQLQKQGYLPTWEVGRGSEYPPRMMVISYTPKKKAVSEHIALVGKGMTFDSGGLCIKPREGMHTMNMDMGGSAAVLGAMEAIARLQLPVKVTAVITSAHNAVDGAAYHPGSVLKARNGKTIYVENTDAEGRLILSDALYRAGEEGAEVIWDFATLTGAVVVALGPAMGGLFTEDEELRSLMVEASNNSGDSIWPMPICREYDTFLKHDLADLDNISTSEKGGGSIHAANFLRQFVPDNTRWAHIDLAGPAATRRNWRYYRPGGTGYGVRLIVESLKLMIEKGK